VNYYTASSLVSLAAAAARADLRIGDIIVELDGRPMEHASQLADAIAAHKPGSTALVGIWRAHRLVHVPVYVKEAETSTGEPTGSVRDVYLPELSVAELSRQERRALPTNGRLLVTGVSAQAAAAGIELGDVILGTANAPLRSVGQLARALADGSGELALLIERERTRTFVALPLDGPQVEPTDASRTAGAHTGPTHPLQ
jgi:serine protease Do